MATPNNNNGGARATTGTPDNNNEGPRATITLTTSGNNPGTTPNQETLPLKLYVIVGNPISPEKPRAWLVEEKVPKSFHKYFVSPAVQQAPTEKPILDWLNAISRKYEKKIFDSEPWKCNVCGERATTSFHRVCPNYKDNPAVTVATGTSLPVGDQRESGTLELVDFMLPLCRMSSSCFQEALKRGQIAVKLYMANEFHFETNLTRCEVCFKCSGLKQCAGCKLKYYCSTKCQAENWKQHKAECRVVQAAREKEKNSETAHTNETGA
ncbi:hypothetical protein PVAG01_05940 [Phlyctema vagabunda]|uniref:MYND-type domain-containing protein n=1 Tax=Phlyctema vagabunda TaxID=108571 RepID=A0ABR4PET4_9HELO